MHVDLRSDTVTLPSLEMRATCIGAALGDDVYGEDPTVRRLEARAAAVLGLEQGLFVASGTMGNLCALLTHASRGQRVICGRQSHVFCAEAGGASALGGLVLHPLHDRPGAGFDPAELDLALASPDDPHFAPAGVVTLENTHSQAGGVPITAPSTVAIVARAHAAHIPVHIDGARLFNAATALGVPPEALVGGADSVQVCLSKGLGAPVGSVLVGSVDFIARARRIRKLLGGGLRQAGVIAAMGLFALDTMPSRLAEDHARARRLADGLRARCGTWLEIDPPPSNVVLLRPHVGAGSPDALVARARQHGVLLSTSGSDHVRAVTHLGIDDAAVAQAIEVVGRTRP